jgi:hypothetical protein
MSLLFSCYYLLSTCCIQCSCLDPAISACLRKVPTYLPTSPYLPTRYLNVWHDIPLPHSTTHTQPTTPKPKPIRTTHATQRSITQYNATQHNTTQHSTTQHNQRNQHNQHNQPNTAQSQSRKPASTTPHRTAPHQTRPATTQQAQRPL